MRIIHTVFPKNERDEDWLGGYSQGVYAVDKAKELMLGGKTKVRAGVINASGDLTSWGNQGNREKW